MQTVTVTKKVAARITKFVRRTRFTTKTRTKLITKTPTPDDTVNSVSGYLFADVNGDLRWNKATENALPNVPVTLFVANPLVKRAGKLLASNVTGSDGYFFFHFVPIPRSTRLKITWSGHSAGMDFTADSRSIAVPGQLATSTTARSTSNLAANAGSSTFGAPTTSIKVQQSTTAATPSSTSATESVISSTSLSSTTSQTTSETQTISTSLSETRTTSSRTTKTSLTRTTSFTASVGSQPRTCFRRSFS